MKKLSYILLFLFVSLCVYGASDNFYAEYGVDAENSNRGNTFADTTSFSMVITSSGLPGALHTNYADQPLVFGNVDNDSDIEFVFPSSNFDIYEFDGVSLSLEFPSLDPFGTPLDATGGSLPLLFDANNDNDFELFFCGVDGASLPYVAAYEWNLTSGQPYELWRTSIAPAAGGEYCYFDSALRESSYAPTGAMINGDPYVFFSVSANISFEEMAVWRFHALTGEPLSINISNEPFAAPCTSPPIAWGGSGLSSLNDMYGDYTPELKAVPMYSPALCTVGALEQLKYYLPLTCNDGAAPAQGGLAVIDAENMVYEEFVAIEQANIPMTSPSCFPSDSSLSGKVLTIGVEEASDVTVYIVDETGTVDTVASDDVITDPTVISDLFIGEFTGSAFDALGCDSPSESDYNYDDVCFFGHDQTNRRLTAYCVDIDNPLTNDEVTARQAALTMPSVFRLYPYVLTSSQSWTQPSLSTDVMINAGVFQADIDEVSFAGNPLDLLSTSASSCEDFRYTNTALPTTTGACSGADFTGDSFMDFICITATNMTYVTAANVNQPVDFKEFGVDVTGTMCYGNQTFFVDYDAGAGYSDPEQDNVRLRVSCTNNATFQYDSGFVAHGTDFQVSCTYTTDGTKAAALYLEDAVAGNADIIFHSTLVSNTSGCTVPDGIESGTTQDDDILDEEEGEAGEFPDLGDTILSLTDFIGIRSQNAKDIFWILVLLVSAGTVAVYSVWLAGAILGLGIILFTVVSLIRPIYLVVAILFAIFGLVFFYWMRGQQ